MTRKRFRCVVCNRNMRKGKSKYCSSKCVNEMRKIKRPMTVNRDLNEVREYIFERDNFKCQSCGMIAKSMFELHCHHIIPLYKGGMDKVDNCETLCIECHKNKHRIK